jgi:hypothetical protein
MIIQINTDKNLSVDDNENVALSKIISEGLKRYIGKITRIEVHLGDVDGKKKVSTISAVFWKPDSRVSIRLLLPIMLILIKQLSKVLSTN